MSIKIQVKNLNLTELGDGFSRELESVPVGTSVDELISRISTELNLPTTSRIEIFYRGEILKRTESLVTYVPESLSSIDFYLIQSNKQLPIKNDKPSAHEIYTLVNALGSLFRSRTRKNYLESLLREPNKLADVLAPLPEIKNDPVCFGFVQNYDLIKFMIDQKRAENMVQSNPNVYYALKLIADHVREFGKKSPIDEKFVSKRSYSIDDASEDEDQHHQAQQQQQPQPVVRSGPAISQDHFAAVLAMLNAQQQQRTSGSNQQQQQQQQNPAPVPAPAAAGSQPTLTPPIFDRNEFQSIMQQIMMSSTTTQSQPSQQQSQQPSSSSQQQTQQQPAVSNEMAAKLEQMHEFGFFDDAQNMRALEITEGNVEAAISLIIDGGDMI